MSFQSPITIAEAVDKIDKREYLLPAIQREFVWSSEKIEWLFDSIMKGYPISSFLFWEVQQDNISNYRFYNFINEYRERYKTHNEEFNTLGVNSFKAILDGQQRLTSLYIGLKGSYAYKGYRKRWENTEDSIPTRHLYLNISRKLENEEDGREYEFKFLPKSETKEKEVYADSNKNYWFKVGKILNYKGEKGQELFDNFLDLDEINNKESKSILRRLKKVIIDNQTINYFLEKEQDLDKALNIFIRINSGGEPLDFSDLIMSIAVANWENLDARKEIHSLVDAIKEKDFNISKDLILKSYLFLYSKDIKFKVTNFNEENAKDFESNWEKIRKCILETFELLRSLGFTDYSLTSKNAVLPIIYYLYHKNIYDNFSKKAQDIFKEDRDIIKKWLHRVLIKRVFGSSSDTVLSQIRQTFTDNIEMPFKTTFDTFPKEFDTVRIGNYVDDDFIEGLLKERKDSRYSFSILSLLYPNLDYRNNDFHKDHIHPQNKFNELSVEDKEKYKWEDYDSICNLQLLDANENASKNDSDLIDWVNKNATEEIRQKFLERHLIPDVDLSIQNFGEFFEERKKLLISKLKELLN